MLKWTDFEFRQKVRKWTGFSCD